MTGPKPLPISRRHREKHMTAEKSSHKSLTKWIDVSQHFPLDVCVCLCLPATYEKRIFSGRAQKKSKNKKKKRKTYTKMSENSMSGLSVCAWFFFGQVFLLLIAGCLLQISENSFEDLPQRRKSRCGKPLMILHTSLHPSPTQWLFHWHLPIV